MREIKIEQIALDIETKNIVENRKSDALAAVVIWISNNIRDRHLYNGEGLETHDYDFMDKISSLLERY